MSDEETPEEQIEEPPAEEETFEEGAPSPEQAVTYELPPTLQEAGLKGVVGVTTGQYTLPSGTSFSVSPGAAYAVSEEDAAALIEQGAGVALEDLGSPS